MLKTDPVILLRGLRVERDVVILDRINWRVEEGEHWVILGQNGSGKTSLLSALTAYLTPSAGEIRVCGEVFGRADWRELRKKVGLVSSSIRQMIGETQTALDVVLSGKEAQINLWGEASADDRERGRVILEQVECAPLAGRHWRHLSQGERQRLLVGRALMADLKLLILDEPCAGLDLVARETFLDFLRRLASGEKSPTLVFVTHHVEEITEAFTHVMLLKSGRVLAAGRKQNVLTSDLLSAAFDADLDLKAEEDRYSLRVRPRKDLVF